MNHLFLLLPLHAAWKLHTYGDDWLCNLKWFLTASLNPSPFYKYVCLYFSFFFFFGNWGNSEIFGSHQMVLLYIVCLVQYIWLSRESPQEKQSITCGAVPTKISSKPCLLPELPWWRIMFIGTKSMSFSFCGKRNKIFCETRSYAFLTWVMVSAMNWPFMPQLWIA